MVKNYDMKNLHPKTGMYLSQEQTVKLKKLLPCFLFGKATIQTGNKRFRINFPLLVVNINEINPFGKQSHLYLATHINIIH